MASSTLLTIPGEVRVHIYSYLLPSKEYDRVEQTHPLSIRLACRQLKSEFDHELIKHMHPYFASLAKTMLDDHGLTATVHTEKREEMTFADTCRVSLSFDASTHNADSYIQSITIGRTQRVFFSLHSHIRSLDIGFHCTNDTTGLWDQMDYVRWTLSAVEEFVKHKIGVLEWNGMSRQTSGLMVITVRWAELLNCVHRDYHIRFFVDRLRPRELLYERKACRCRSSPACPNGAIWVLNLQK
ncbi:hypothetical protein P154DRAFT_579440 [Amniculicola lignicola CBS 123094]|uniref:F-box domain-containing protein n=1 Tax=Amniculicola lignicola CBS 123094 TaxID=1392246 RepID=A0A6A5W871_9PLEO|nr:hypothetical protein P154DRAFT_579440 [Amniculicola lignicola CBS 123094]